MATVTIEHEWGDGQTTRVRVQVSDSYPQCVNEAGVNARRLLRGAIADLHDEAEVEADEDGQA
jgi:hypothetical protein